MHEGQMDNLLSKQVYNLLSKQAEPNTNII